MCLDIAELPEDLDNYNAYETEGFDPPVDYINPNAYDIPPVSYGHDPLRYVSNPGPQPLGKFQVKDSGKREQFDSGMVRDTTTDKIDYSLVLDGPMFKRWAEHLTKGAKKYQARNWLKAAGQAELDRFRESAIRHFVQWMNGEVDEDHAAATYFNICGAEYVKEKMGVK